MSKENTTILEITRYEDEVANAIDFIIVPREEIDSELNVDAQIDESEVAENQALTVRRGLERRFKVENIEKFTHYLRKRFSSRYQAIILNAWNGTNTSVNYEVGLVQIKNGDHRDGVIRALRVSPLNVKFLSLDEPFFEYLHGHLYNDATRNQEIDHQHKKDSQKTKQWGDPPGRALGRYRQSAGPPRAGPGGWAARPWLRQKGR